MRSAVAVAMAVLVLGGCAQNRKAVKPHDPDQPFRIGREDVLDVSVWRDADLSRTLPVRPDGMITMPIVGELVAAGKTPSELAGEIRTKLQAYVQDPKVTVIVREVNSSQVFVTGEVARPGSYPLRGRLSVLQAVALAGGLTAFADANAIVVIRKGEDGGQIPVRYGDILAEEGEKNDIPLAPGDTVVVP